MEIRIILNGKKAGLPAVREAIFRAREELSPNIEVRVTWEHGDVHRLVEEAVGEKVDRLVAGGGDGSVNEVVDALMRLPRAQRPELAILPLGTANDFATGCQIPIDSFCALDLAISGKAQPVDVVCANDRHFINIATGGFGAQVTTDTPVALKNFLGGGAYTLTGLVKAINFKPYPGLLTSKDFQFKSEAIVGAVCNGRQAGGGQILAPNAYINDGLIDFVVLEAFPFSAVNQVINEIRDPDIHGTYVKRFQTSWVDFSSDVAAPINLDGEPYHHNKIRFEVAPHAVDLVVPEDCPCLKL